MFRGLQNGIQIRTFERGVEDETYSCGTGVVGATLVTASQFKDVVNTLSVKTVGGELEVSFERKGNRFYNIWLTGPAVKVFEGEIS